MKVRDGIQVEVVGRLESNCYLVEPPGSGTLYIIDPGSDAEEIVAAAKKTNYTEAAILFTHAHVDHYGGLPDFVHRTGAVVAAHPLDSRPIAACGERLILARRRFETMLVQAGVPPTQRPQFLETFSRTRRKREGVPVGLLLDDGRQLDGMNIFHTPGHSPGHLCILIHNVLLVGDHILARTITQQWPESTLAYTGLGHYLESLEKVEKIPGVEIALGGHEPPIYDLDKRISVIRASDGRPRQLGPPPDNRRNHRACVR